MRRSRRSKPVSMLGAFLIEVGTMLAFIALAQPTWTHSFIEQMTTSPAVTTDVTSVDASTSLMPNLIISTPPAAMLQSTLTHQTLRPTLPQQVALPHVSAPALLNMPTPAWSNTAWNNGAGSRAISQRSIVKNNAVNNAISSQGWQPSVASSNLPPWSDTTERVAQANWSAARPAAEYPYAPQYPVYPPSNWSSSY